jgi:hypothetical protein
MAKKKSRILFGTDPECFAGYLKNDKLYTLPPYFFRKILQVHASDDDRHPVFLTGEYFKAHEDGAAFEFAIRPSFDPKELFERIQEAAKAVNQQILSSFPEYCLPSLQFVPTIGFDVERWKEMEEDFFMSTMFGCDPDEDVFNLSAQCMVMDASKHPYRYAGGHLHMSGNENIAKDPHSAIRCMALTAGLAAIANSPVADLERDRTLLYGRPGKFRVQNYGIDNPFGKDYAIGIEYRTPSCTWAGNWKVAKEFLKWAEIGIKELLGTKLAAELDKEIMEPAIEAILSADKKLAKQLLAHIENRL